MTENQNTVDATTREDVARAIFDCTIEMHGQAGYRWDQVDEESQQSYLAQADAAIKVMTALGSRRKAQLDAVIGILDYVEKDSVENAYDGVARQLSLSIRDAIQRNA